MKTTKEGLDKNVDASFKRYGFIKVCIHNKNAPVEYVWATFVNNQDQEAYVNDSKEKSLLDKIVEPFLPKTRINMFLEKAFIGESNNGALISVQLNAGNAPSVSMVEVVSQLMKQNILKRQMVLQ